MPCGNIDQLLDCQRPSPTFRQEVDQHTRQHGHKRSRQDFGEALGLHEGRFPEQQNAETHRRDGHGSRRGVSQVVAQKQQNVEHFIRLRRAFSTRVTEAVRDLLDENDDANGGQHALDDACRKVLSNDSCAGDAEQELRQASNDNRQQKGFKAHFLDAVVDNHSQSSCGTRHADMAA